MTQHRICALCCTTGGGRLRAGAGLPVQVCEVGRGLLLVYSITNYSSYQSIQPLYQHIRKVHPDARTPIIIVGNKADLLHARQVQAKEGLQLANELGSLFLEISTSEDSQGVCDVFQYLCKEVSKLQHAGSTDRRRSSIMPRPKSPTCKI